jgi:glycosyltransferase involved in cell wall biosynthesis
MRILHITYSLKGGAGAAAYRIHRALLDSGVESTIIALNANDGMEYRQFINVSGNCVQKFGFLEKIKMLIKYPFYSFARHFNYSKYQKIQALIKCDYSSMPYGNTKFIEQAGVNQYDIIHLHWVSHIIDYSFFFKECTKPIVWTLHDINPLAGLYHYENDEINNQTVSGTFSKTILSLKLQAIQQHSFNKIFVGPSYWITNYALENTKKIKSTKVIEIPNPVNMDIFYPVNKLDARLRLGLPVDGKIILFSAHEVGNSRKGFDVLLEALQYLDSIYPVAIGNNPKTPLEIGIHFTGLIINNNLLRDYYSAADVVVIPSREDNLPNVMIEAFACGTPVVGFSVGGIQEHVTDFYTGVLASEINSLSLAEAIKSFFRNDYKFNRSTTRDYAVQKFSPVKIAAQYIKEYEIICK